MSTFDGIVREFPSIRIDNFTLHPDDEPPLACFLSHVHNDHLKGLETFKSTFVYCTAQTRELLLRLEKYPHRMNFAKGILESRKQTYRRLKNHLKPIPLETPTEIELSPVISIRVTLFDANHCLGSCMFLVEGNGRAILYTGDVRCEQWWVDSLIRNPMLLPYTKGNKSLDNIYLDNTFTSSDALDLEFPSKAEGLSELIEKVSKYPSDTIFYLDTWTFGYEEVWVALCAALNTKVHLDDYRWRLYHSQRDQPSCYGPQIASLVGFKLGNHEHSGCLSNSAEGVRIHSCERGTRCEVFENPNVVRITPIIARRRGIEIAEVGAGGGQGDLNQTHSLELYDEGTVQQLLMLCAKTLKAQPQLKTQVVEWFSNLIKGGRESINLDLEILRDETQNISQSEEPADEFDLDQLPIDRIVPALLRLITGKSKQKDSTKQERQITFPFSRHSSYLELRELVQAFKPKDVYPCTIDLSTYTIDISMEMLFGSLCSSNIFQADKDLHAKLGIRPLESQSQDDESQHSTPSPPRHVSPLEGASSPRDFYSAPPDPEFRPRPPPKAQIPPPQPRPPKQHLTQPSNPHLSATKQNQSSDNPTTTPNKRRRTSSRNTPGGSASRDSGALKHRAWKAAQGLEGEEWDGFLTSVSGYHNQEREEEL